MMRYEAIYWMLLSLFSTTINIHAQPNHFSASEIRADVDYLTAHLQKYAAYARLEKTNYQHLLDNYKHQLSDSVKLEEVGLFLTEVIGKLGDRHASVRNYDLADHYFLPFVVAPHRNQVLALKNDENRYAYLHPKFPYLTAVNGVPINEILMQIIPEEIAAPTAAYHYRAVKQLRHIEESFEIIGQPLSDSCTFTFSGNLKDTIIKMELLPKSERLPRWRDAIAHRQARREELNDPSIIAAQFETITDIAYLRLSDMVSLDKAPNFYDAIHQFMQEQRDSRALIIDIRDNGGGTRDLTKLLSQYFVHPDSIYVVNVAFQRSDTPLNNNQQRSLAHRYLLATQDLSERENEVVERFISTFQPKQTIDKNWFSEAHFLVLNGISSTSHTHTYFYEQPIYVLMNERSFSAASIMAAAFSVLPNVQLVGTTTDGSSGNSREFWLPHTQLRIKISTMLSFQADGQLLDGFGTMPHIIIPRSLKQVLWEEDTQLTTLIELINAE